MKNVCYTSTNQKLHDLNGEMDDEHGWWDMRETEDSELSQRNLLLSSDSQQRELSWFTNLELFEMLDSTGQGVVGFREFCALMYLIASVQSS